MSVYGSFDRDYVVSFFGEELVRKVESLNCEPTSRVMQAHEDDLVEYTADVKGPAKDDGQDRVLVAYYYQSKDAIEENEDLGNLNWEIDHFGIY